MEILGIRVLRGPNFWSNNRKNLIVVNLDIRDFEYKPTNLIDGFYERLKLLLPSLYFHHCSEGKKGGFFDRVIDGTWLGHVYEHIALELQYLAGMPCSFGRTRSSNQIGIYHVVYEYKFERAGLYCAETALKIIQAIIYNEDYDNLNADIRILQEINNTESYGPSTQSIINAAYERNIPITKLDDDSTIMFGYGCNQQIICATTTSLTSNISVENTSDKEKTKQILRKAFIPVPSGMTIENETQLITALQEYAYPCVIKPLNGNHGRGITTNIKNINQAIVAFHVAKKVSEKIIIEKHIEGCDYRFLVINYKLVAAAKRTPPSIIGNGKNTIQELIEIINNDVARGISHENLLTKIKIDEITQSILQEKNLNLESILPKETVIILKHTANISTGGTAIDVTDEVHNDYIFMVERIARMMHLDICGIDIIAADISAAINNNNFSVLEVNSGPGFRMHLAPSAGKERNVGKAVIDMLYADESPSRIPIIAVTGTNGKTTTVRLIAHIVNNIGYKVGFTTTEGIYVDQKQIYAGDCAGPVSAETVLRDPLVEFAVLECARGGILRNGLGFDQCSISIILNISDDHLGQDDIHNLENLARVKEVVARSTMKTGYSILNADDDFTYDMRNNLDCKIALFSLSDNNPRIKQHCEAGGIAIYLEAHKIIIQSGNNKNIIIENTHEIPICFNGQANFMLGNLLPAILACHLSGFNLVSIIESVKLFYPNKNYMPGKMNIFNFPDYTLMLDYAHNEAAVLNIKDFLQTIPSNKKVGIISATGDRRDRDIINLGYIFSTMFDEIIIKHDIDGRGRTNQELTDLLLEGINHNPNKKETKIISDEFRALDYAIQNVSPGNFIFYFPDNALQSLQYIEDHYPLMSKTHSETIKE